MKKRRKAKKHGEPPNGISFRLDPEPAAVLRERAVRLEVSVHALAREYVMEVLMEADERMAIRAALDRMHADLGLTAAALLTSAGKVNREQANAWVKENFP